MILFAFEIFVLNKDSTEKDIPSQEEAASWDNRTLVKPGGFHLLTREYDRVW